MECSWQTENNNIFDQYDSIQQVAICLSFVSAFLIMCSLGAKFLIGNTLKNNETIFHRFLGLGRGNSAKLVHNSFYLVLLILNLFIISMFNNNCNGNSWSLLNKFDDTKRAAVWLNVSACVILFVIMFKRIFMERNMEFMNTASGIGYESEFSKSHNAIYLVIMICNLFSISFFRNC